MAGTIRAFGGVEMQAPAGPAVEPGSALGTELSSRLDEFTTGKDNN